MTQICKSNSPKENYLSEFCEQLSNMISYEESSTFVIDDAIGLTDLHNLLRTLPAIRNKKDAKFENVQELINAVMEIAKKLKNIGNFSKIYIIFKSFNFGAISYNDILKIILWGFSRIIPEWKSKLLLILVNGINDRDKAADDGALFVVYNELLKADKERQIYIISNDNFYDIKDHYFRNVTLNFYTAKKKEDTWEKMDLELVHNIIFQPSKDMGGKSFNIYCPEKQEIRILNVD